MPYRRAGGGPPEYGEFSGVGDMATRPSGLQNVSAFMGNNLARTLGTRPPVFKNSVAKLVHDGKVGIADCRGSCR
jgi:hypothetical protein